MNKILFILPTFSAGGAENYVLRFLKHYYKDFDFHVMSVNLNRGDLHEEFKALGIPMFYQSIGYFDLKRIKSFYFFLIAQEYDSIISFTGNFSGLPLTIAKYAGVKNRIVFHRRSTNAFGTNPFKLIYNNFINLLLRKNATSILSNSETALRNFYGKSYINDARFKVIKNGVDVLDFNTSISKDQAREKLGLPIEKYIVGHVGRYDPAKNHQTIFKVIKNLKSSCENLVFIFCGIGTDGHTFKNELEQHQIEDVVITLGMRRDLPLIYKALDIFYFPSITEGQPNALIEAMISGLPIITSNIPPILEALPTDAGIFTLQPTDVNAASEVLEGFYNQNIDKKLYQYQNWAIKNFDALNNFNEFKDLLK